MTGDKCIVNMEHITSFLSRCPPCSSGPNLFINLLMVQSCAVLGNKLGQGGSGNKVYLQNTCLKWPVYLELGALPSGKELCRIKSAISLCDCQPASPSKFTKSNTPAKWLACGV